MIDKIRERMVSFKGRKLKFKYNGSRNQVEEFNGVISSCYKFVFVIDVGNMKRSFSYTDVLIGVLEVDI